MQLHLKQAAFLAGRRYPAGALVDDYQGQFEPLFAVSHLWFCQ